MTSTPKKWTTIQLFIKRNTDWPSESSLRWMIYKSQENGLDAYLRKIGGRVLIDEQGFWEWIDSKKFR